MHPLRILTLLSRQVEWLRLREIVASIVDGQDDASLKVFGKKIVPALYTDEPQIPALTSEERSDCAECIRPVMLGNNPIAQLPAVRGLLCTTLLYLYYESDMYPESEAFAIAWQIEACAVLGDDTVEAAYDFLRWYRQRAGADYLTKAKCSAGCAICLAMLTSRECDQFLFLVKHALGGHDNLTEVMPSSGGPHPWQNAWDKALPHLESIAPNFAQLAHYLRVVSAD